jgi:hypothetical protein
MSKQFHRPSTGDTRSVPDVLAPNYEANPAWKPGPMPDRNAGTATELKGAALDEALEAAGLSRAGTADEKRARLAEAAGEEK